MSESNRSVANPLKALSGLTGHDALAPQKDEQFAMPWNEIECGVISS